MILIDLEKIDFSTNDLKHDIMKTMSSRTNKPFLAEVNRKNYFRYPTSPASSTQKQPFQVFHSSTSRAIFASSEYSCSGIEDNPLLPEGVVS